MNDEKGQLSGEYMLLVGSLIVVLMISIFMIANENELNIAMAAAKSGADEGVASSSSAIYPKETFNEYDDMEGLKHPYSVSIVNVSYNSSGIDENYGKQKIQFKASADYNKKELDSIGDRINYNLRKSVATSFNTTDSTNKLYNPVFSNNYVFTTANVVWV